MYILDHDFEWIYQQSADIFRQLSNSKIFITGGTGFFGKWLLGAISYANRKYGCKIEVTALSRNPESFKSETKSYIGDDIQYCCGDVRTFTSQKTDFDFLIHGAVSANPKDHREFYQETQSIIDQGTLHFLEFARKTQAQRILSISSGAVFGQQKSEDIWQKEEQFPLLLGEQKTSYALGKRTAEEYSRKFADETSRVVTIARCFGFVGPFLPLDQNYAVGNFIGNCLKGEDILIQGDGTPTRSYLYAADLIVWLLKILMYGENKKAYNVGSEESVSIADLAANVKKIWMEPEFSSHRSKIPDIKVMQVPDPKKPVLRYVPSTKLGQTDLNLKQWTTRDEGIRKSFRFYVSGKV